MFQSFQLFHRFATFKTLNSDQATSTKDKSEGSLLVSGSHYIDVTGRFALTGFWLQPAMFSLGRLGCFCTIAGWVHISGFSQMQIKRHALKPVLQFATERGPVS